MMYKHYSHHYAIQPSGQRYHGLVDEVLQLV